MPDIDQRGPETHAEGSRRDRGQHRWPGDAGPSERCPETGGQKADARRHQTGPEQAQFE
jgi:hypothetical protein